MAPADAVDPRCRLDPSGGGRYTLVGGLDLESAASVLASGEAEFAAHPQVEIDLSGVTGADSSALAVLIEWTRSARRDGRNIAFTGMPARLGEIARISGVYDLLPITD